MASLSSGLALIKSYSDNEDESDISTLILKNENKNTPKDNSKIDSHIPLNKLPLPLSISQLYKSNSENNAFEDDPNLHDGRVRSFPHQRGNWSTFVYVPYTVEEGFSDLLSQLQSCAVKETGLEMKTISEPHISLTRTVVLLHHWINSFVASVKERLNRIPSFILQLGSPAVYCNDDKTRTFLGLKVVTGHSDLYAAARVLDNCLDEFRLPPFYKDPSFHMSVLWVVGDAKAVLEALLPKLEAVFEAHIMEHPHELEVEVTQCLCKTGNKMFSFPLAT